MKKNEIYTNYHQIEYIRVFRTIRSIIWICGGLLSLKFFWLKFQNTHIGITTDLTSDILFKTTLGIYFSCWVFGLIIDANFQEEFYKKSLNIKNVIVSTISFAIILTFLYGLLCFWTNSYQKFFLLLLLFLVFDFIGWLVLTIRIIPKTIEDSLTEYKNAKEYGSFFSLNIVKEHIAGRWRFYRFIAGFIFILIIGIILFTPINIYLCKQINITSPDLIMAISFLIYVIGMEGYIYYRRIHTRISISAIEKLMKEYKINLK